VWDLPHASQQQPTPLSPPPQQQQQQDLIIIALFLLTSSPSSSGMAATEAAAAWCPHILYTLASEALAVAKRLDNTKLQRCWAGWAAVVFLQMHIEVDVDAWHVHTSAL
jgi:hypothetical protein